MNEDRAGQTFSGRAPYEVNSMIEDKTDRLWFATRGNTFVYDGKTFTVVTHENKPFRNVRCIIEDKKGNIWLAGADGLWRYNDTTFTCLTQHFVGQVMEDKKGDIWTSGESARNLNIVVPGGSARTPEWALARYDEQSLYDKQPIAAEIKSGEVNVFGIAQTKDGSIWFGDFDGVHRYDGKTITDFKRMVSQK